jgi:hypothetical protein
MDPHEVRFSCICSQLVNGFLAHWTSAEVCSSILLRRPPGSFLRSSFVAYQFSVAVICQALEERASAYSPRDSVRSL